MVEHRDGAVGVAEVLQRTEQRADPFHLVGLSGLQGPEQRGGEARGDADAAGGEPGQPELPKVDRGGLFADAADHQPRVDHFQQRFEQRIRRRVRSHHGVLDPRDHPGVDQGPDDGRGQVLLVLDVEHDRAADPVDEAPDGVGHALGMAGEKGGEEHGGGEPSAGEDRSLVHEGAEERSDRRDHDRLRAGGGLEALEDRLILVEAHVVEVGVPPVEEDAHAAVLEVAHEPGVGAGGELEVGVPAERRDGDDRAGEVAGREGGFHAFQGASRPG